MPKKLTREQKDRQNMLARQRRAELKKRSDFVKFKPKTKPKPKKLTREATKKRKKDVRALVAKEINRQMRELLKVAGKGVRGKKIGNKCTVQGTDAVTRKILLKEYL